MIYLSLFWEFFKIGLFAVGGGLATLPFLFRLAQTRSEWITVDDISNMIAVSESTPGPMGVNMPSTGNLPVLVEKAPIIAMIITNHQFTNEAEVTYEELQSVLGGDNGNLKAVTYQAVSKDITDTGYRLYVYNNTSGTLKLSVNTSQSTPLQSVLSGTNYYMRTHPFSSCPNHIRDYPRVAL